MKIIANLMFIKDPLEYLDNENLNFLVKKFSKFMKKKGRDKRNFQKKSTKKIDSTPTTHRCFEYGKLGHIKEDCPTYLKKQQRGDKKQKKPFKQRRRCIACDDNDASSLSDSSEEEEEANLCLIADIDEDETKSNVSVSSSKSNTNYDNLLDALEELHEEAHRLTFVNKTVKGQLRWHIEKFVGIIGNLKGRVE